MPHKQHQPTQSIVVELQKLDNNKLKWPYPANTLNI